MFGAFGEREKETPAFPFYELAVLVPGQICIAPENFLFIRFHDYDCFGFVVAERVELFLVEGRLAGFVKQFQFDVRDAEPVLEALDVLEIQDVGNLVYFVLDYVELLEKLEEIVVFGFC